MLLEKKEIPRLRTSSDKKKMPLAAPKGISRSVSLSFKL